VDAGAVSLSFGSARGLDALRTTLVLHQPTGRSVTGDALPEPYDRLGASLASCDFDADGYADLAVGVPNEDIGSSLDAGAVHVFYGAGSAAGAVSQLWHQNSLEVPDVSEAFDRFGTSVACGEFSDDERAELVIGVPSEDVGTLADAGVVHVLYGFARMPTASRNQLWHQDSANLTGAAEAGDRFGATLAVGDLGNGRRQDLAIGVPGEDWSSAVDAGAVAVLFGGWYADGVHLGATGNQLLGEASAARRAGDAYGASLAIGDFDGDSRFDTNDDGTTEPAFDLAIGIPGDDPAGSDGGAVRVRYGVVRTMGALEELWHQSR
jgi:hypothetical protein